MNKIKVSTLPKEVQKIIKEMPPVDWKLSDRDMLLVAYGAMRAIGNEQLELALGMVQEHLFPSTQVKAI